MKIAILLTIIIFIIGCGSQSSNNDNNLTNKSNKQKIFNMPLLNVNSPTTEIENLK